MQHTRRLFIFVELPLRVPTGTLLVKLDFLILAGGAEPVVIRRRIRQTQRAIRAPEPLLNMLVLMMLLLFEGRLPRNLHYSQIHKYPRKL